MEGSRGGVCVRNRGLGGGGGVFLLLSVLLTVALILTVAPLLPSPPLLTTPLPTTPSSPPLPPPAVEFPAFTLAEVAVVVRSRDFSTTASISPIFAVFSREAVAASPLPSSLSQTPRSSSSGVYGSQRDENIASVTLGKRKATMNEVKVWSRRYCLSGSLVGLGCLCGECFAHFVLLEGGG